VGTTFDPVKAHEQFAVAMCFCYLLPSFFTAPIDSLLTFNVCMGLGTEKIVRILVPCTLDRGILQGKKKGQRLVEGGLTTRGYCLSYKMELLHPQTLSKLSIFLSLFQGTLYRGHDLLFYPFLKGNGIGNKH